MSLNKILVNFSSAIILLFLIYRSFTTFTILPLVAYRWSFLNAYFCLVLVLAFGVAALSLTRHKSLAGLLAILVGSAALAYWWLVICHGAKPIWSDFVWFVIPEILFTSAVVSRWKFTS
jgi:hypothetical protein